MSKTKQNTPFRADVVGSFLRPQYLINARERYEAGQIDSKELKRIEDIAISDLIEKQKAAGLQVITDGEFRRHSWHLDFMWGLNGVKRVELSHGYFFHGKEKLIEDLAAAYRTVIKELYEAGCRNVQLDDCTWGMVVDPSYWQSHRGDGVTINGETDAYLKVNNLAIEGAPANLVINTHVCRGNYESCFAASGAYDPIAPILFPKENVNAFYLEYDDERSGGFEPLKYVSGDKKVVLGLITTKRPELEDKEAIKKRIQEASKYVPLDRLYLSPQCGFSSNAHGNKLTEDEQWAKIALVQEIAKEMWG